MMAHEVLVPLTCNLRDDILRVHAGSQAAVVAHANGELVALLVTSPVSTSQVASWGSAFKLHHALPGFLPADAGLHVKLEACVINPVFAVCTGALLAGVNATSLGAVSLEQLV